jgi:NAD(P)-dependent dehydrogenase (short-subunit alcohol dehydrogenase family)
MDPQTTAAKTPKRALVLGATGGLGSAIAEDLAHKGWVLTLAARRAPKALAKKLGAQAIAVDLSQADQIHDILTPFDAFDGLVQAAGTAIDMTYASQTKAQGMMDAMAVEVQGFMTVVQTLLPGLRQRQGSVVALTSAALQRHAAKDILSTAPKAAVEAFLRAIAAEEGRYGVRANAVAVGVIDAGMFLRLKQGQLDQHWQDEARARIPLGRFGQATDVAATVAFLLSERASYITGQSLAVDGGYAM